jgi:hypothetical protein
MRNGVIILALLAVACMAGQPLRAQQVPAAVVADPAADKQFPPELSLLTVPSHGVEMDAFLYLTEGRVRAEQCYCCTGCRVMR